MAYQHLFWFYGHPVVYVMFFPFLGIVAEVIATSSAAGGSSAIALMVSRCWSFAALSMSVWAHHMFTIERHPGRSTSR